jgi:hypothetical protein
MNLGAFFAASNLETPQKTGLFACIFYPTPYTGQKDTASIPCAE